MKGLRTLSLDSAVAPDALMAALERAVVEWSGSGIPAPLRARGVLGLSLHRGGLRFTLRARRSRRVVAPIIARGRIEPLADGSRLIAELRPSRRWLWFPALGSVLLAVQIALAPPTGMALLGYSLILGALWAVNLLAAVVPVGSDPAAEAAELERLLRSVATASVGA